MIFTKKVFHIEMGRLHIQDILYMRQEMLFTCMFQFLFKSQTANTSFVKRLTSKIVMKLIRFVLQKHEAQHGEIKSSFDYEKAFTEKD